ncbi:DUF4915 domain-containing protein [Magnetococcales bacterium HHB-1]
MINLTEEKEIIPATSFPIALVSTEALKTQQHGAFWDILDELKISLVVSREQENFLLLLSAAEGYPRQSTMTLAQPTGIFFDQENHELIVGTTRSPNQILYFKAFLESSINQEICPLDLSFEGTLYLPTRALFLPGTLYTHDVVLMNNELYILATDHNFLARVDKTGGWQRVWWPKALDQLTSDPFRINRLQLNSIAVNRTPSESYYTAFSDEMTGPKPWRSGYGPDKRGVVFSGQSRERIVEGLTCPHSIRLREQQLWLCNSGYGELVYTDKIEENSNIAWEAIIALPGFVRGLCFYHDYAFVGLSKVLPGYEHYAPGIDTAKSRCGISVINWKTGQCVAELHWPEGYEIYDIQILPDDKQPSFPDRFDENGKNLFLDYAG